MRVMFFEDEYTISKNVKFRLEINEELPELKLDYASTVSWFEKFLAKNIYHAFIIDIMSTESDILGFRSKEKIERSLVGIEIMDRIRNGYYQNQNKNVLIIVRSARATEPDIRRMCIQKKADFILSPGADDHIIIDILQKNYVT